MVSFLALLAASVRLVENCPLMLTDDWLLISTREGGDSGGGGVILEFTNVVRDCPTLHPQLQNAACLQHKHNTKELKHFFIEQIFTRLIT